MFWIIEVPRLIYTHALHVKKKIESISFVEAGGNPPENGIFSITLYVTAIIGGIMIVVRYVYVSSQNETNDWKPDTLNKIGFICGFVSFIGMMVLASYPIGLIEPDRKTEWESRVLLPHMIGAFLLFFFGAIYLMFQTALTLYFCEGRNRVVIARFVLFMLSAICFVTSTLSTIDNVNVTHPRDELPGLRVSMKPLSPDPPNYIVSAICEWLMVFMFAAYFFTFFQEGQKISVSITFRTLLGGRRISIASIGNLSKI